MFGLLIVATMAVPVPQQPGIDIDPLHYPWPHVFAERVPDAEKRATALIRAMGSEDFRERDRASRAMEELGYAVLPALYANVGHTDPEVRRRVRDAITAYFTQGLPALADMPSIFRLGGPLRHPPALWPPELPCWQDRLRRALLPVGDPKQAEQPGNGWNAGVTWPINPDRFRTCRQPAHEVAMLCHLYYGRVTWKARRDSNIKHWYHSHDTTYERAATALLVYELLLIGCDRAWIMAMLRDMEARDNHAWGCPIPPLWFRAYFESE